MEVNRYFFGVIAMKEVTDMFKAWAQLAVLAAVFGSALGICAAAFTLLYDLIVNL